MENEFSGFQNVVHSVRIVGKVIGELDFESVNNAGSEVGMETT